MPWIRDWCYLTRKFPDELRGYNKVKMSTKQKHVYLKVFHFVSMVLRRTHCPIRDVQ